MIEMVETIEMVEMVDIVEMDEMINITSSPCAAPSQVLLVQSDISLFQIDSNSKLCLHCLKLPEYSWRVMLISWREMLVVGMILYFKEWTLSG